MTSLSVSDKKVSPAASSSSFSCAKFSMMPLCTRANFPHTCGCAFTSVGAPCVAHLVCPIPVSPARGAPRDFSRRPRACARTARRQREGRSPPNHTRGTPGGRARKEVFRNSLPGNNRRRYRTYTHSSSARTARRTPSAAGRSRAHALALRKNAHDGLRFPMPARRGAPPSCSPQRSPPAPLRCRERAPCL